MLLTQNATGKSNCVENEYNLYEKHEYLSSIDHVEVRVFYNKNKHKKQTLTKKLDFYLIGEKNAKENQTLASFYFVVRPKDFSMNIMVSMISGETTEMIVSIIELSGCTLNFRRILSQYDFIL